ncbi:RNA-directed DNA polymerase, eukaryota [Tanacetum coccineum]
MGDNSWQFVTRKKYNSKSISGGYTSEDQVRYRSKEDDVNRISTSIYVTNFPDSFSAKDLFQTCKQYGHVIDSFIPEKKSKEGKRFGFVRFINVFSVDRLVGNLCTIWINRLKLHANIARYQRESLNIKKGSMKKNDESPRPYQRINPVKSDVPSFASALKGIPLQSSPAMVLDDSCLVSRDLDNYVLGEVKQFSSINNLRVILSNEGFSNVQMVLSFDQCSIGFCVKTKQTGNILESFKIVIKGKIFVVRAKELFVWSPSFKEVPEAVYCSDDDSVKGDDVQNVVTSKQDNLEVDSDGEAVPDSFFGEQVDELENEIVSDQPIKEKEASSDPFNIYGILNNCNKDAEKTGSDTSIPFPPGFTPQNASINKDDLEVHITDHELSNGKSAGCNSRILEEAEKLEEQFSSVNQDNEVKIKEGGSILMILDEMIKVGRNMGYSMEGLGSRAKKDWIRELSNNHKVSFLTLQETKMEKISSMEVKFLWGNYNFDHIVCEALGNSGGILCVWDPNVFQKKHHIISDNFVALYGMWIPKQVKMLLISVYAPQSLTYKRMLWSYLASLISQWDGESIVMGDFNEVRSVEERWGSTFNALGASVFNDFITNSGLSEVQLEGYSFTWTHPSASKMSKLDRFLVTEGLLSSFPNISAICLDRHLSDHRPILLREIYTDFGATPFRLYHSWFNLAGFDHLAIRLWVLEQKNNQSHCVRELKSNLSDIDKKLDQGDINEDLLLSRMAAMKQLQEIKSSESRDYLQKAKIQWAIEGYENSKFFHGIINRKRANLSVKGILVEGDWVDEPSSIKDEFRNHFATRFQDPGPSRGSINFIFPNRLNPEQASDLESPVTRDEIRNAVWSCGENKSPGPDGFTFEFFRKFRNVIGSDFCIAVEWFFDRGSFAIGCNSSFIALIPKILDPKCGDPLAPFLFVLVMESFHLAFSRATDAGVFNGIRIGSSLMISHLFYADDAVPKAVLNQLEGMRRNFFNGIQDGERKIAWVKWSKVLASKKYDGVRDHLLHSRPYSQKLTASHPSLWNSIIKEIQVIKLQGDSVLKDMFPRLYSLENFKDCYVADKILSSVTTSFRRPVRDRWVWDMNDDGVFRVKDVRNLLDDTLLPKDEFSTRWVKCVPIKINVFAWKIFLDRLPTRLNLYRRGVVITSVECPNCDLLSVLIPTGSSGSKLFEWVQKRKTFWKGSFTLLGGAFGVTEIISCLRIRKPRKS